MDTDAVTVFFGANDSCLPPSGQHVPLEEYRHNLERTLDYIRAECGSEVPIIILTPPAIDLSLWKSWCLRNEKPESMWTTKSNLIVSEYAAAAASVRLCANCHVWSRIRISFVRFPAFRSQCSM